MRCSTTVVVVLLDAVFSASAHAQAARVGRLPVLAPMRASALHCQPLPMNADLRRLGVATGVMARDSVLSRTVSLAMTADGRAKLLIAMMSDSTGPKRRELETVTVTFDTAGRVVSGWRHASTRGVPARLSEDRRSDLLPADTASALALANAMRSCGRR